MSQACIVPGCYDKKSSRRRLPNPRKYMSRFEEWLDVIGREDLKKLDPFKVFSNRRICGVHFKPDDTLFNNRLHHLSRPVVPSLFLPKRNSHLPGTPILKDIGVRKVAQLSPQSKKIYKKLRSVQRANYALKRRVRLLKSQVESQDNESNIETLTSQLSPFVANFVKTQIRMAEIKPKGRRFNIDDKVLGIILQKSSPKCYNLLSNIFVLPSMKTNSELLSRIPLGAGINEAIFDNLRASVSALDLPDRVAILLFDEMSIEPHVSYNSHSKEFSGFEDDGERQTSKFSDHALVFMAKGLNKKWKVPLAYSYCQSTTQTINLARQIRLMIAECQKAGLEIVATVSDQGATNVGAINYLCQHYNAEVNTNCKMTVTLDLWEVGQ